MTVTLLATILEDAVEREPEKARLRASVEGVQLAGIGSRAENAPVEDAEGRVP
jgi:hypothetical protein